MTLALAGVAAAALLAVLMTLRAYLMVVSRSTEGLSLPPPPTDYGPELTRIDRDIEDLRIAVAEGIQHVERVEKRIAATVRRARKELAEDGFVHEGLEAEAAQLHLIDGGGGEASAVPPMPEVVEPAQSSIPGVSRELLMRARGR